MWKCHSFYQIKWITRFLIQLFCYTYASLGSIRGSKRSLTLKVIWQEVQVWRSSVFFKHTSSTDTDDVADLFLSILLKYLLQSKNGRSGLYLNAASQTFPISPPCRGPSQHSVSLEQTGTEASLWDKEYNVLVASSSSTSASAGNLIFCHHFEKHDISCYGETHTASSTEIHRVQNVNNLISYVRVWHPRPLFWSPVWFCLLCLYIWWLDVSRMVFFFLLVEMTVMNDVGSAF